MTIVRYFIFLRTTLGQIINIPGLPVVIPNCTAGVDRDYIFGASDTKTLVGAQYGWTNTPINGICGLKQLYWEDLERDGWSEYGCQILGEETDSTACDSYDCLSVTGTKKSSCSSHCFQFSITDGTKLPFNLSPQVTRYDVDNAMGCGQDFPRKFTNKNGQPVTNKNAFCWLSAYQTTDQWDAADSIECSVELSTTPVQKESEENYNYDEYYSDEYYDYDYDNEEGDGGEPEFEWVIRRSRQTIKTMLSFHICQQTRVKCSMSCLEWPSEERDAILKKIDFFGSDTIMVEQIDEKRAPITVNTRYSPDTSMCFLTMARFSDNFGDTKMNCEIKEGCGGRCWSLEAYSSTRQPFGVLNFFTTQKCGMRCFTWQSDLCMFNNGGCEDKCQTIGNERVCSCPTGKFMELAPNKKCCIEVDMCTRDGKECAEGCTSHPNLPLGYFCTCDNGNAPTDDFFCPKKLQITSFNAPLVNGDSFVVSWDVNNSAVIGYSITLYNNENYYKEFFATDHFFTMGSLPSNTSYFYTVTPRLNISEKQYRYWTPVESEIQNVKTTCSCDQRVSNPDLSGAPTVKIWQEYTTIKGSFQGSSKCSGSQANIEVNLDGSILTPQVIPPVSNCDTQLHKNLTFMNNVSAGALINATVYLDHGSFRSPATTSESITVKWRSTIILHTETPHGIIPGTNYTISIGDQTRTIYENFPGEEIIIEKETDEDSTITITPSNRYSNTHTFDPPSYTDEVIYHGTTKTFYFKDTTIREVSGHVFFEGSDCGVSHVKVCTSIVDSNREVCVLTGIDGNYTLPIDILTTTLLYAVSEHVTSRTDTTSIPLVDSNGKNYTITNITNSLELDFFDSTKHNLKLRAVGGSCNFNLGSAEIKLRSLTCPTLDQSVQVQNTWQSFQIAPLMWEVELDQFLHFPDTNKSNPNFFFPDDAYKKSVDLSEVLERQIEFRYYAIPTVRVQAKKRTQTCTNSETYAVMKKTIPFSLNITILEEYKGQTYETIPWDTNNFGGVCSYNQEGTIEIYDNITQTRPPNSQSFQSFNQNGDSLFHYEVTPSEATKDQSFGEIQVRALRTAARSEQWGSDKLKVAVTGVRLDSLDIFQTKFMGAPVFGLRKPPGSKSYSFIDRDSKVTRDFQTHIKSITPDKIQFFLESLPGNTASCEAPDLSERICTKKKSSEGTSDQDWTKISNEFNANEWDTTFTWTQEHKTEEGICLSNPCDANDEIYLPTYTLKYTDGSLTYFNWDDCTPQNRKVIVWEPITTTANWRTVASLETELETLNSNSFNESLKANYFRNVLALHRESTYWTGHTEYVVGSISDFGQFKHSSYKTTFHPHEMPIEIDSTIAAAINSDFDHETVDDSGKTRYFVNFTYRETASSVQTSNFVLDDDNLGDAYKVIVKNDSYYGGPVFITSSDSVTACPVKFSTTPLYDATGNFEVLDQADRTSRPIPPTAYERFYLTITSSGDGPEPWYVLYPPNGTNAVLVLDGQTFNAPRRNIFVPPQRQITLTLDISIGKTEYDYHNLEFVLRDKCHDTQETVSVSVSFSQLCPVASILYPLGRGPTKTRIINQFSDVNMNITIFNPLASVRPWKLEKDADNLKNISLEYKAENSGWKPTGYVVDSFPGPYKFKVDTSLFPDGSYIFRAKIQCKSSDISIRDHSYTKSVSVLMDRQIPRQIDFLPKDEIWSPSDKIEISFDDRIICPESDVFSNIYIEDEKISDSHALLMSCGYDKISFELDAGMNFDSLIGDRVDIILPIKDVNDNSGSAEFSFTWDNTIEPRLIEVKLMGPNKNDGSIKLVVPLDTSPESIRDKFQEELNNMHPDRYHVKHISDNIQSNSEQNFTRVIVLITSAYYHDRTQNAFETTTIEAKSPSATKLAREIALKSISNWNTKFYTGFNQTGGKKEQRFVMRLTMSTVIVETDSPTPSSIPPKKKIEPTASPETVAIGFTFFGLFLCLIIGCILYRFEEKKCKKEGKQTRPDPSWLCCVVEHKEKNCKESQ